MTDTDTQLASALLDTRRLAALRRTGLLDSPPEPSFDRLTRLAARFLNAPVALVSLVDEDRQFFMSCVGLPEPWASDRETPVSHSFCRHVVAAEEPLVITDARQHPLVRDNPAVSELGVVAYAGIPLVTREGAVLGSFCAIDTQPRRWTEGEIEILRDLAAAASTEIELRASEAKYRLLFEGNPNPMWIFDRETLAFLEVNEAAVAHYGFSREEFLSMTLRDIRPTEELPRLERLMRSLPAGLAVRNQGQHREKDGTLIDVEVTSQEITFGGRAARLTLVHDMTARVHAEAALRESEEQYRRLFEELPVGMYRTTPDGRWLDVNSALVELLGFPDRESLLATSVLSTYVNPHDRLRWRGELRRKEVVRDFEIEVRRYGGGTIWVRHSTRAVPGPDGGIAYYEGAVEDITARRKAERALEKSEQYYRSLTENASDVLTVLNPDGTVRYSSPSILRVCGHTPAERAGRDAFDLVHPDDLPLVRNAFRKLLESPGETVTRELRIRHADGSWRTLATTAKNLLHDPAVAGVVVNSRDLTEAKLLEEQ
ncbi:MAG: PAS domain S-box protein, partial [Gemmatimonadota bacterium]|nr:PAS domain S-box protein [Gemmatimonadota bacterium]